MAAVRSPRLRASRSAAWRRPSCGCPRRRRVSRPAARSPTRARDPRSREIAPIDDIRSTAEYRRRVCGEPARAVLAGDGVSPSDPGDASPFDPGDARARRSWRFAGPSSRPVTSSPGGSPERARARSPSIRFTAERTSSARTSPENWARWLSMRSTSSLPIRRRSPRRSICRGSSRPWSARASRDKLRRAAGRGLPDRFRGWLRESSRLGGGRPRGLRRARGRYRVSRPERCRRPSGSASSRSRAELAAPLLRTLELFLSRLLEDAGRLPPNFVVTLAKVTSREQVSALAGLLAHLERRANLPEGAIRLEIMVETTQSIVRPDGAIAILGLVDAGRGRCIAAHFGTYDYTAALNITAAHQNLRHPACDFARHVMQVALAGTGVWLSDGATNVLPVPPHRSGERTLTKREIAENRAAVHAAWKMHYDDVRRSLVSAYYQGWDLHAGAAPHPLRGAVRVFPGRSRRRVRAAAELRRESRTGHARRGGLRRRGDGTGPLELFPARVELRRDHGAGGGRKERADARGAARAVVREDPEGEAERGAARDGRLI